MIRQAGFTLFELMIAIVIIAILTAIGLPAYQGYVKKAAMTDMLQVMTSYKTSVEMCILEEGSLSNCNSGSYGIPNTRTTNYVSAVTVTSGKIKMVGKSTLKGLTATLKPAINTSYGNLDWSRTCSTSPADESLTQVCDDALKF